MPAPADPGHGGTLRRGGWQVDLRVFALFACLFLLNAPDRGPTGDAHDYFVPVTSLVDHGSLAAPPDVFIWERNLLIGPDGGRYTLFPVGQSLAMLPFYAAGRFLSEVLDTAWLALPVLNVSSALFAALAVLFVWKTLSSALAMEPRWSLVAATLYGLGTMLVPYAKVLYSEALQSALVAALLFFLLEPVRLRTLPALALTFGLLVLVKPVHLVFFPLVLYAAFRRGAFQLPARRGLWPAVLVVLPCAACFFAWNVLRTGHPFDAYGDAPANLEQNQVSLTYLAESLRVLFVSPTKHLFLFNPVLVLAVAGAFVPWPARFEKRLLLGYFAAQLLVFGVFHNATSQGKIAWGPRYAMVFIPALVPFIAVLLGWIARRKPLQRGALFALCAVVACVSIYVQVLASAYDFFDPKVALCGAYEGLQKQHPALPDCDGEELATSIVRVHHYLLWNVSKQDLERGTLAELPWVKEPFEPNLATQLLSKPRVRERVLDKNLLFFGLPARGAEPLKVVRALLCALIGLLSVSLVRRLAKGMKPAS